MLGTEVYKFFASVNEFVVPEFLERAIDGVDNFRVKGESEAGPVAGCAKCADLKFHIAALLVYEAPDLVIEVVTSEIEAGLPFCFEFAFVDYPGFETGVISARDIPGVFTFHAVIAD